MAPLIHVRTSQLFWSVAEMWLREARTHGELNSSSADGENNVPTVGQLFGLDARLHSLYVEDINAPSLAHPAWRQGPDHCFTGSRDGADRVLRDISSALDHVHRLGVTHNEGLEGRQGPGQHDEDHRAPYV